MIYRGPGFLAVVWFGSPPFLHPSPVSKLSLFLNFPINLLTGEGGKGARKPGPLEIIQYSLGGIIFVCRPHVFKMTHTQHEILKCHKNTYYSTHVTPSFATVCISLKSTHVSLPGLIKGTVRLWIRCTVQYILSLATSYFDLICF